MSAQCGKNGFCDLHPVPRYEVNSPPLSSADNENASLNERIRRPPNAFMIFAQEHRKLLAHQNPQESNKKISTILGNVWRQLSKGIKDEYYQKAKLAEVEHKQKYPDYVYNPQEARKRKELKAHNKFINKVVHTEKEGEILPSETATSNAVPGMDMKQMFEGSSLEVTQQNMSANTNTVTMSNEVRNKILLEMGILPLQTNQTGEELKQETLSSQIPLQMSNNLDHSLPTARHGTFNVMPKYRGPMRGYFMPTHYTPGVYPSPYVMSYRPKLPYHRYYRMLHQPWEIENARPSYPVYSRRYNYLYTRPNPTLAPLSQFYPRGSYSNIQRTTHTLPEENEDNQEENQAAESEQDHTHMEEAENTEKPKTAYTTGNPWECCQKQWSPAARLPMNSFAPPWMPTSGMCNGIMPTPTDAYNIPQAPPMVQSRMYPSRVPTFTDTSATASPYGDSCHIPHYSQQRSWNPWLESKPKHFSPFHYHPYSYQSEVYNGNPFMYTPHESPHQNNDKNNCETTTNMYFKQYMKQESSSVAKSSSEMRNNCNEQQQLDENYMQSDGSSCDEDNLSNSVLVVDDNNELTDNRLSLDGEDKTGKGSDFGSAITRAANVLNYENYTPQVQDNKPLLDLSQQCVSTDHPLQ